MQTPKNDFLDAANRTRMQDADTPNWLGKIGLLAGLLFLFVLVTALGPAGPHGPARHLPPGIRMTDPGWPYFALLLVLFVATLTFNGRRLTKFGMPRSLFIWLTSFFKRIELPILMPPNVRKWVLVLHVTTSIGAMGAVAAFLALSIAGSLSNDPFSTKAYYAANAVIAQNLILPLIVSSIVIGVFQALATAWGLIRHYWLLLKLFLTTIIWLVLLIQLKFIAALATAIPASGGSPPEIEALMQSQLIHATGGIALLMVIVAISVFKPRGLTMYGRLRST